MDRLVGTVVRGIRMPIINQGDNIENIVVDNLVKAANNHNFDIKDNDIIGLTESIVARAQGNYANIDDIVSDIRNKYGKNVIGVVFPILSRNRFAICLKAIAKAAQGIVLLLSYPADEVGNHLISIEQLDEKDINPWSDVLTEEVFLKLFGSSKHPFTGIDYVDYYKSIMSEFCSNNKIVFSNNPKTILNYTKSVLTCDIHTKTRTQKILKQSGAEIVYGLEHILSSPNNNSGFNEEFGLLGSNKATEDTVKLFPRNCQKTVETIQKIIKERTGKTVEVMIYGDGAFKDPIGKIWELADPVVSPAWTKGLSGKPSEIKLKYIADNFFKDLRGEQLKSAISDYIKKKTTDLTDNMLSQGTTPRRLTDLIGSLCDLTSGSGDKGTPVVYIQGYFDNYIQ